MEDKIVYVPVSVEDELPKVRQTVIWCMQGGGKYEGFWDESAGRDWVYLETDNGEHETFAFDDFTHWLKPTSLSELLKEKQVIGDEEVEKLAVELLKQKDDQIKDAFDAGYDYRSSLLPDIIEQFGENSMPNFEQWLILQKRNAP